MSDKKIKTTEEVIVEKLTGESRENALDFVKFLNESKLILDSNCDGEGWDVGGTVGNSTGYMLINESEQTPGPWTVWLNSCDFKEEEPVDNELRETVWSHAGFCGKCHPDWENCGKGDRVIFGKEFKMLCNSPLMFTNPDFKTLHNLKKLILMLN